MTFGFFDLRYVPTPSIKEKKETLFHVIPSDVVLTTNNNFSNFKNQILERGVDHEVLADVLVR